MGTVGWEFTLLFWIVDIFCLFTVCALACRKEHTVLGGLGIYCPMLRLIGAPLPAQRGARHTVKQAAYYQARWIDDALTSRVARKVVVRWRH